MLSRRCHREEHGWDLFVDSQLIAGMIHCPEHYTHDDEGAPLLLYGCMVIRQSSGTTTFERQAAMDR